MSSMLVTLNLMPQAIYEFKNSCVLKRIGATPIKPLSFILITGIYYFLMMIVSLVWCFVWMIIIFIPYFSTGASWGGDIIAAFDPPSIATIFQTIDWGGFIYSWILTVLVGICMGMVLVSFTKSSLALQTTGLFITIVSMFLAAQALPVSVVRQSDFFWYLGYVVTPFKSVSTMMNESWNVGVSLNNSNASTIFNVNSQFCAYDLLPVAGNGKMHLSEPTLVCDTPEKIINLILPWIWAAILSLIAVKKFKWSTR